MDRTTPLYDYLAVQHAKLLIAVYQLKFRLWHMASNQWLWSLGDRSSVTYFWK